MVLKFEPEGTELGNPNRYIPLWNPSKILYSSFSVLVNIQVFLVFPKIFWFWTSYLGFPKFLWLSVRYIRVFSQGNFKKLGRNWWNYRWRNWSELEHELVYCNIQLSVGLSSVFPPNFRLNLEFQTKFYSSSPINKFLTTLLARTHKTSYKILKQRLKSKLRIKFRPHHTINHLMYIN